MKAKRVLIVSLTLVAGLLAASAAFAVGPYCDSACSCNASCSTVCYWDGPVAFGGGGTTNLVSKINCQEYGLCQGLPICGPTCGNQSCTSYVYGTSGSDTLYGGSARECIYGYSGNDTIDGGAGDDRIWGSYGTDTLTGNSGDDCLWGNNDADYLSGDSGYDFADGGSGSDTCYAEAKVSCP